VDNDSHRVSRLFPTLLDKRGFDQRIAGVAVPSQLEERN
jgi:hypothetical protein